MTENLVVCVGVYRRLQFYVLLDSKTSCSVVAPN